MRLTTWLTDDEKTNGKGTVRRIPTVYFLTEKAAETLRNYSGITKCRVLRSDPSPATIHHRIDAVHARRAFDRGCKMAGINPPLWILESDMQDDVPADVPPHQRSRLYHAFNDERGRFTCMPDMACLLTVPANSNLTDSHPRDIIIAWEIDQATEGSKQLATRSNKGRGYQAWLEQQAFVRYWTHRTLRTPLLRVFWVVPSVRRIATIIQAVEKYEVSKSFRFLTKADRDQKQIVTDRVWYTTQPGERLYVYDPNG